MQTTTMNGHKRPNLSDQIDRLDRILDGLADALNQSVATAVQEAVRGVLTELLSRPELLARLVVAGDHQATLAPAPVAPTAPVSHRLGRAWRWLADHVGVAGRVCVAQFRAASQWCLSRVRQISAGLTVVGQRLRVVGRYWRPLLVAAGCGTIVGLATYGAAPYLAGVASGVGASATALAIQAGLRLRRLLRRFSGSLMTTW